MKWANPKVHSFCKANGGKNRYARQYIDVMCSDGCPVFCEPYCFGAGVLMNIVPETFEYEIINDINPDIYRCLRTLEMNPRDVIKNLEMCKYEETTFSLSQDSIGSKNDVAHTVAYIVRNRMSSGGMGERFGTQDRLRGGQMGDANAFYNFVNKYIYGTIERLSWVNDILNMDAIALIKSLASGEHFKDRYPYAADEIFYFLDPPYLPSTLVSKKNYPCSMTEWQHAELLDLITSIPGRFYLCGYNSPLYQRKLVEKHGWTYITFNRAADSGRTARKSKRVEYLWTNYGG